MPGTDLDPTPDVPTPTPDASAADGVEVPEAPVSPDLVFTTSKKDRPKSDDGDGELRFQLDGETYTAYRPADSSFALLAAAGARSMPTPERIATVMRFLDSSLDELSASRLRDRLEDADDDLELEDLFDVMVQLVKKWTASSAPRSARRRGARHRR